MRWFIGALGVIGVAVASMPQDAAKPGSRQITFNADILPILKANCLSCHTGASASAGFDMTKPENVAKKAALTLKRIRGEGGLPVMPLGFKPLPAESINIFAEWIKAGSPIGGATKTHWAYVAPVRPAVPAATAWANNPIDHFVLAKLKKSGLSPSPEANWETLVRRLYLDLIGLPPTLEQLDRHLKDQQPGAYERLVDELLASPHYGERQARIWLDLARYADSNGYEKDAIRIAYPYRDWVIKAFNQNLSFDTFSIQQLAGDLLPKPTNAELVATGFHRNTMFNEEGGTDPAEQFYNTVVDRVSTTSTVWLGSTLGCARCHDHKYDPISQKDFFRSYAVFANTDFRVVGDYKTGNFERWIEPTVPVMEPETEKSIAMLRNQLGAAEQALAAKSAKADQTAWREVVRTRPKFEVTVPISIKAKEGTVLTASSEGIIHATGPNPRQEVYILRFNNAGAPITGLKIRTLEARAKSGNFVLTGSQVAQAGEEVSVKQVQADFIQAGYNLDLLLSTDRSGGWAISPRTSAPHELILEFREPIKKGDFTLTLRFESPWEGHGFGRFEISTTDSSYPSAHLVDPKSLDDSKTASERFLATANDLAEERNLVSRLKHEISKADSKLAKALILQEKPTTGPLKTPMRQRGEFLAPGEMVTAGMPSALPAPKPGTPINRLTYAQWLVAPENPLTARVQVNRFWQQYFGIGLVETDEDFGTQGSRPTNPELLDWLATEFVARKWDMKAMHRLIVTSATYRQRSEASPALLEKDPNNVLLARGSRGRMEAEMIRDTMLTASGLLSRKIGGPSVMPYQPDGVWDSPYNGERWMETQSEDRYRRGIYVFAKRTAMYPSFMALDATSREVCTTRRSRTNTPLQALALLNDRASLEAARALGAMMSGQPSAIEYGFRAATGRLPSQAEKSILTKTLQSFQQKYQARPDRAKALGTTVEQAAWTMMANVLLNLDETITKS